MDHPAVLLQRVSGKKSKRVSFQTSGGKGASSGGSGGPSSPNRGDEPGKGLDVDRLFTEDSGFLTAAQNQYLEASLLFGLRLGEALRARAHALTPSSSPRRLGSRERGNAPAPPARFHAFRATADRDEAGSSSHGS